MKTKSKANPKVTKVLSHLNKGIENCGAYTGEDFKTFCREFKSMITSELNKVGATNYVQSNGHYYISGFFTLKEQPYYICLDDVRYDCGLYNKENLLIRTCTDYSDFRGGTNNNINIDTDMFLNYFTKKLIL